MTVNEAVALAERIESLIRRTKTFNKSREDIVEELWYISYDLRDYADRLDAAMEQEESANA
jgi:siderophore synthetase component